jgi:phosphoribosylanthranilate isomerase
MPMLLKFCGVQTMTDYGLVVQSQADYIGFIFAPSKRKVNPEEVGDWVRRIGTNQKKLVGVFVNAEETEIAQVLHSVPLDVLQLHGNEMPTVVQKVKKRFNLSIWKALPHGPNTMPLMKKYHGFVDGFLIDTKVKGAFGGTGQSFDWTHVPVYIKESHHLEVPCFIAGGIHAMNVEDLLTYAPDGIDVSSGIEKNGQKDRMKIQVIERKVKRNDVYTP